MLVTIVVAIALLVLFLAPTSQAQQMYTLRLRVLDSNGEAVPYATVWIGKMEVRCGPDGRATLDIAQGQCSLEVFFMGVSVSQMNIAVTSPRAYDIVANIFRLQVYVVEEGRGVAGALVKAYATEEWCEAIADETGVALFRQLPATTLTLYAFKDGKQIADDTFTLQRNDQARLERTYYYVARFHAIDKEKVAARNVGIQVGRSFNSTDDNGVTEVEVREGTYGVKATMYGLTVYTTTLTIRKSELFNITVEASTLRATLLDETQNPYIGSATVHVGRENFTINTDPNGGFSLRQVPHGELGVSTAVGVVTKFRHDGKPIDVNIITRELRVSVTVIGAYMLGSMQLRVSASIGEIPLKRTRVTVMSPSGGSTYAITDSRGIVEVNVPLFFENPATVKVRIVAYEQEKVVTAGSETSPLMLFIVPLGIIPLVLFKVLTIRYKKAAPAPL